MFNWLTERAERNRTPREIYGSIVASARQETFFAQWGVPDTREGRFEMLALQVAVVMRRLEQAGPRGVALSRAVAETFMTDLDDNMREIGVGDLAVPRKIKRAAAALYDRHRDYGAALNAQDGAALAAAIEAAVTGADGKKITNPMVIPGLKPAALAAYAERLSGALVITSNAECLTGTLPLPWPAADPII